ncbi:hypothetical protein KEH51_28905 [[Brevibacterium] frigoritolerans]|uniref:Uncharacterized protein n=1 Tax=Peribacillus frigoritolerans TaxID=450367 RepID=A0A941FP19_9BACI|nr:hypothetical protein [Peribacillus frigoritolerans]
MCTNHPIAFVQDSFILSQCCTESKDLQKVVALHWQEYTEEADHLRHHESIHKKSKGFGMKPFRNLLSAI